MTDSRFFRMILYIVCFCITTFLLFRFLFPILFPFLIAFLLAQLAEPAITHLSRRLSHSIAAILVMSVLFLFLGTLLFLLFQLCALGLTRLSSQLPVLLSQLQPALETLRSRLLQLASRVPDGFGVALKNWVEELFSDTSSVLTQASDLALSLATAIVSRIPGIFLFLITAIVASYMIAAERESVLQWLRQKVPQTWQEKSREVWTHLKTGLWGWLRAEFRMVGITFLIVTVGLFLIGISHPLLFGILTALVDLLPVLGTGTVLIPWSVLALLQGNVSRGTFLFLLYCGTAALRTTLEPRLVGKQIGLHPLLALLSMYAGFQLFGIGGLILLPVITMLASQLWRCSNFRR